MSLIKDSKGVLNLRQKRGIDIYENIKNNFISNLIAYLIDSKYRTARDVSPWIKKQIEMPSEEVKNAVDSVADDEQPDRLMLNILNYVRSHLAYTSDHKQWDSLEHWSPAEESLQTRKGDCEDGAILIYVLARLKGIPANRLYIWAGDVMANSTAPSGGHSCLFYKPTFFPYNFIPLDWCYYPSNKKMDSRNLLFLKGKEITEYTPHGKEVWSNYERTWFLFNENKSYSRLKVHIKY